VQPLIVMNKMKIQIVDDDVAIGKILKKRLERTGHYEVRSENKSTNTLTVIRDFEPDIILLNFASCCYICVKVVLDTQGTGIKADIAGGSVVIGKSDNFDQIIRVRLPVKLVLISAIHQYSS